MFSRLQSSDGATFCVWSEVIADRTAISLIITDGDVVWESCSSVTNASGSGGNSNSNGNSNKNGSSASHAPVFDNSFITNASKPVTRRESWNSYLDILESALENGEAKHQRFDYYFKIEEEEKCLSLVIKEILPVVPALRIPLLQNFKLPQAVGGGKLSMMRLVGLLGARYNDSRSELKKESERNNKIKKDNDFLFNELSYYKAAKEKTEDDLFRKFALILNEKRGASFDYSGISEIAKADIAKAAPIPNPPTSSSSRAAGKTAAHSGKTEVVADTAIPAAKRIKAEGGGSIVIGGTSMQVLNNSDELDFHLSQNHHNPNPNPTPNPNPAPAPSVSAPASQANVAASGVRRRGFFARGDE